MNALFVKLSLDQLDEDYRAWIAREFPDMGTLRMTIVRYRPTGQIDFIFHEERRPPRSVMRNLARLHLLDAPTVGTMQ
jgi:hypothetical protein